MSRLWLIPAFAVLQSPLLAQAGSVLQSELPPAGFGSLHQDDIAIRIEANNVAITILPLDERVTRLLAPDTYGAVHQLVQTREEAIAEATRRAGFATAVPLLVTVYALDDQVSFNPDQVILQSRGRTFRPEAVLPISTRWSEYRLPRRETASAIFLFDDAVDVLAPLTVQYASETSTSWEKTLRRLEVERTRVEARAKRPGASPP